MKIYIASSWKNVHAVELLTAELRAIGHEVLSFVENNYAELEVANQISFDNWVASDGGSKAFDFDVAGATRSDLIIYISPSGKDAAAEVGAAWASGRTIFGLYAKGEDFGLMRRMVTKWFDRSVDLLDFIIKFKD